MVKRTLNPKPILADKHSKVTTGLLATLGAVLGEPTVWNKLAGASFGWDTTLEIVTENGLGQLQFHPATGNVRVTYTDKLANERHVTADFNTVMRGLLVAGMAKAIGKPAPAPSDVNLTPDTTHVDPADPKPTKIGFGKRELRPKTERSK